MAAIDSITFSITRTSYPTGHICSIDYSYFLRIDDNEFEHHQSYNISVMLFGDDLLRDKPIGDSVYDVHTIDVDEPMPVNRQFAVDCDVLDEALGEDKIFIKISAVSNSGEIISAKSETIKDWF
ncbi:hypothetical protein [Kaarinaea lacus]